MSDEGSAAQELAELRARIATLEAERLSRPPRHRAKSFLAALLIVLGCVLAPLGIVAAWAADEVGDTDRYVATVAPLASDPAVQDAVANRVTDALMTRIDLASLLSDAAPEERPLLEKALGKLGDSLDGAVRSFVHDKARAVAASDAFATLWTEANRKIHASVDKALTGSGGGAVSLEGDTVTLDLGPVVDLVKQRLVDEGMQAAGRIPEIHTDFTLVRSDEIGKVKTYVRLLQITGNWLPVLAVLLVAGGVLLSRRRRRALVAGALGVAAATALLGIGLRVFRVVYLDALPAGVSPEAAGAVYDTLTHLIHTMIRMVVALGLVLALSAWLTGPGRRAGLVRGLWTSGIGAARSTADRAGLRTGPVGPFVRRHRSRIVWALVAAALAAYVLWSYPTGWVVVGLALALLFALAVVEFLGAEASGGTPPPERAAPTS
ncbi:LPXTG cell wall anchor domain-containing protein [Streptomyces sp. NBC_00193]|uniref:LPXTG cell wall anchor domain-containing protein n=1 Tax=unclassified Streptomyces TaxID=2593676 RepID=UPI00224F2E62|nr:MULTISPECIES: LPXTG cell wall anchor domain-containing protein [unclassified Streptomyces]MCX5123468.1 LPXTG cell wall anchor domain-containing protein [Streptomyces sp. NBC_00347]MCX5296816.1 LPXTG cell wall anchor domain-containing protein [Streptomyces sp. NBC_00193]